MGGDDMHPLEDDDTPDGPDEVQADPHDDPDAEVLDGEDAPVNLDGAPSDVVAALSRPEPGED